MNNTKAEIRYMFTTHDYKCVIVEQPMGFLCGYVLVPYWHPAFGKDYDDIPIKCHGGLTYASHDLLGKNYRAWFIGFDCDHADDFENPKDVDYCIGECKDIVRQLIAMENEEL